MPKVAPIDNERRAAIRALNILDTPAEDVFDGLARLAALVTDCPIALISFIDEDRHWFKASVGVDQREISRDISFCEYTLQRNDIFVVPDATLDPRFQANPVVTGPLALRFYCGVPLAAGCGPAVGTICLLDTRPRTLSPREIQAVKDLQAQANSVLGLRLNRSLLSATTSNLQSVESENRRLLNSITDIVYATDTAGRVTHCNAAAEWILKYPAADMVGEHYLFFVHPEARHRIKRFYEIQFARRIPDTRLEFPAISADGTMVWLDQSVRLLMTDGEPVGFYSVARDATERREKERLLRESESRFRVMAENSPVGIFVTDEAGQRLYVNRAYTSLSGYSLAETIGTIWSAHIHPDDVEPIRAEWYKCAESGIPFKFTHRLVNKGGSQVWVHIVASAIRSEGVVTGYVGTLEDVTLRKEAEDALKYANERLERRVSERTAELARANDSLRELTKHLESVREEERAHIAREIHDDLGQALSALKMEVASFKAAAKSEGAISPEIDELSSSMTELVELTIGSVRRIATELRPAILDTLGLFPALEWLCEDFARRSQIACDFRSSIKDIVFTCDASTAIFRICQESLTNVMRHSEATKVSIRITRKNHLLVMKVKDNGNGMQAPVDAPGKGRPRLGVVGMRERAAILGGILELQNRPSKGTMAVLKVPFKNLIHETGKRSST